MYQPTTPLPAATHVVGDPGHVLDHNQIIDRLNEISQHIPGDVTDIGGVASADVVHVNGDQNVAGKLTFAVSPEGPTPTTTAQFATKGYVDGKAGGGGAAGSSVTTSGDQSVDGVKTFSALPVVPTTAPTVAGQVAAKKYVDDTVATAKSSMATDSAVVHKATDETVTGVKTFSSSPVVPTPTTDMQASTKKYVDDKLGQKATDNAVVHLTGAESVDGAKTFVQPVTIAAPTADAHAAQRKTVTDAVAAAGRVTSTSKTAAYTLALADAGTVIEVNATASVTVTVPTNATVAFPIGTILEVCQVGAGQVTIAGASGVTLRSPGTLISRTQWSTVGLRMRAANDWVVSGDTQ